MATQDSCTSSMVTFMVPPEPCPLPSLGSDEESFVVLWKDKDNYPFEGSSDAIEPIGPSVVEEAKQLINKELLQIEQASLSKNSQSNVENGVVPNLKILANSHIEQKAPEESLATAKREMEQSSLLPKMPLMNNGFDTSEVISITTLPSDFASVEVQKKVSQIIEENMHLKDTILQNNMSMKSQYERIVSWQEDVQKVHQAHKDKIIEAKEFIEKLKKENYNLIRDLNELREAKNKQDEELAFVKNVLKERERQTNEKLIESTAKNMNAFELDIANKKIRDLELAMQNLTVENSNLKSDQENLTKSIAKVEEYEKEIEKLQEALDNSKLAIEEVKMELQKERAANEAKDSSLNEVIENLRSQLFYRTQEQIQLPSPEEVANIRQQLANTQVLLTQVELSKSTACAQVEALNKENIELKKRAMQSQKDEIYALQTQLEVYKADFEAEREAKETIKTENVKLSEDMQNLQRRNQQLQEEIDLLRERGDFVVYSSYNRDQARQNEPSAPSESNDHEKKCPRCSFGFNTYQALENHVYRCVELDDQLP